MVSDPSRHSGVPRRVLPKWRTGLPLPEFTLAEALLGAVPIGTGGGNKKVFGLARMAFKKSKDIYIMILAPLGNGRPRRMIWQE
jgi:hypothetical protein